jgi:hypothetical protein
MVLNREDKLNKYFYVYEVFGERMIRKIRKIEKPLKPGVDDSDAFDMDLDGKVLIYSSGEELIF